MSILDFEVEGATTEEKLDAIIVGLQEVVEGQQETNERLQGLGLVGSGDGFRIFSEEEE